MGISMNIIGLNQITTLSYDLSPDRLNKAVMKSVKNNLGMMQKRMKLRAQSRSSTKYLSQSIKLTVLKNKVNIDVNAYYAYYLIAGYKKHVIPVAYMDQHRKNPNSPGKKISKDEAAKKGFTTVTWQQSDDFFTPVFESEINKIEQQIGDSVEKTITRRR